MYNDDKQNKFGFLDNIKDKLGMNKRELDDYDHPEDYEEVYHDDRVEDEHRYPPHQGFGNRGKVSARSVGSYARDRVSSASLVSYEDARAVAPRVDYQNSGAASAHSGSGFGRRTGTRDVQRASDYTRSIPTDVDGYGYDDDTPASSDPSSALRSQGLNSLFTSTSSSANSQDLEIESKSINSGSFASASSSNIGAEPASQSIPLYAPKRNIVVVAPISYSNAVDVTTALKAKEVVILNLRMAPDSLRTRILDFAFGVASAMDAYVELVQDGIYSIYFTTSVTPSELSELRSQGKL